MSCFFLFLSFIIVTDLFFQMLGQLLSVHKRCKQKLTEKTLGNISCQNQNRSQSCLETRKQDFYIQVSHFKLCGYHQRFIGKCIVQDAATVFAPTQPKLRSSLLSLQTFYRRDERKHKMNIFLCCFFLNVMVETETSSRWRAFFSKSDLVSMLLLCKAALTQAFCLFAYK